MVMRLHLENEVCGESQASLESQGQLRADRLPVLDDVADHAGRNVHRPGGSGLGQTVMGKSVAQQAGYRIGRRIRDFQRIAANTWRTLVSLVNTGSRHEGSIHESFREIPQPEGGQAP